MSLKKKNESLLKVTYQNLKLHASIVIDYENVQSPLHYRTSSWFLQWLFGPKDFHACEKVSEKYTHDI